MSVAGHYSLTLSDVNSLKLWEMNYLLEEMDKANRASKYPAGATPVMT